MDEQQREDYLLEVLQRKLTELKTTAINEKPSGEHQHGPDYQRGVAAGFVSGLGFAVRVLAPEGELWPKAAKMLDEYNRWAQDFNRRGRD
ncbi:hypothetical protein [Desulforamulus ruminis]|uniref:Uncharacterized protein n=1 Tax=Desulforamulus ruminis (strain ATCC 23193 / DSM 2154 / NCIMB 8452 / DL) TaxID=696281 RepID=F6DV47_DESRL|nr:hypothetical protein [Desulforamulus ruminis]AEG59113.1 hypothetical protein Desru_0834 [Desulforamulus ruminis DSM 2154]